MVQPFGLYNLPNGSYLCPTGVWTFDLKNDRYYIPVGFGADKKAGAAGMNFFIEAPSTSF